MPDDFSSVASIRGPSDRDVQDRLKAGGYNEPRPDRRTPVRIILEVVREPTLALLLGAARSIWRSVT